ncbi:MAG: cysteine hydrolase [Defluviitaleaceae bacterium]|nr:cysteine hydrolase [Defluviitaleaceae bacterium]
MKVLIVVDMQKDFITGALGTAEAADIVSNVVKRIENSSGELILFTQDTHRENYLNTAEGKKLPVPHCIEGTDGWKIDETILNAWRNNSNTIRVSKLPENTFTKPVFGSVDLVAYLKACCSEISEIELLGVCTDICVVSNALMIKNTLPDIKISVNANCCAGVTPKSHTEALNVMQMCHIDII